MLKPEQRQGIIDDFINGVPRNEIAIRNNCSISSIYFLAKKENLFRVPQYKTKTNKISSERNKEIIEMNSKKSLI